MTYQEYLAEAKARFTEDVISLDELKKSAIKANEDLSLPAVVLDGLLEALGARMSEVDFIDFCEMLYG